MKYAFEPVNICIVSIKQKLFIDFLVEKSTIKTLSYFLDKNVTFIELSFSLHSSTVVEPSIITSGG